MIQLDKIELKIIGVLKDVQIQLMVDPQIQDIIDIHVVDILEIYRLLLSREWIKCLRGWFSIDFTHLWLPWKGLNNQIKIDVELKLKIMITEYNMPNKVPFLLLDVGSYKVMAFDINSIKILDEQSKTSKISIPKPKIVT